MYPTCMTKFALNVSHMHDKVCTECIVSQSMADEFTDV